MPRSWMSGFIVLVLSMVSCSGADPDPSPSADDPRGTLGRSAVEVPEGWEGTVTITAASVTDSLVTDTQALLDTGLLVGMPLEISTDQPMPPQGLTISRTYAAALPADMAATLAFFNAEAGGWQAVPSQISADRRTVSATVDHLSIWNDFVLGTEQALTGFRAATGDVIRAGSEFTSSALATARQKLLESADWMYYAVGKTFDTRVDAPVCDTTAPKWVNSVTTIEDHRNNPIRFCSGYDTRHPDLLVVKARVNRGFAFSAVPGVDTAWRHNSSDPTGLWEAVLPWLRANDEALRDALFKVTGGDPQLLVGAGQELGLGLDEKDVRAGSTSTVLTLEPPSAATFVYSVIGQLIMQDVALKDTSLVTTALAMSSCFSSIAEADRHDPLKVAAAVLVCLQSQSETITKLTVRIMTETGFAPKTTVSTSRALTRASMYLALVGPVFSAMNWYAETQTLKSARTVDVFTTAAMQPAKLSETQLRNSTIPAGSCYTGEMGWPGDLPIVLSDGEGWVGDVDAGDVNAIMDLRLLGQADVNRDGADEIIALLQCAGSPPEYCCAGQTSLQWMVAVFSVDEGNLTRVATPYSGGLTYPGDEYGPLQRGIAEAALDGASLITHEHIHYSGSYTAEQAGGDPLREFVVRLRLDDDQWIEE